MSVPLTAARYAAFISYSHTDEPTAKWLHRKLETYRTPRGLVGHEGRRGTIQPRLGKIFRDRAEFAAGGELKAEIQEALRQSESLIVLCSPRAAASLYVTAEIEYFKSLERGQQIFPVILEGEPGDSFPRPLKADTERLGADLRTDRDGRDAGLLRLLAGLHGVGFDDLVQRERVAQRRRLRAAIAAVALFAGLAIAAAMLGLAASRNGTLAERRAALMSIDSARSQLSEGDTDQALLILLDAARVLRDERPDALLIGFQEALTRAESETLVTVGRSARLFDTAHGVYVAGVNKGDVSLIKGDGTLRRVSTSSKAAAAVLVDDSQSLIVVREDLTIESHAANGQMAVVGAFNPDYSRVGLIPHK